jgi:hypothetical protein
MATLFYGQAKSEEKDFEESSQVLGVPETVRYHLGSAFLS